MTDADARLLSDYLHLQSCIEGFNFLTQQLFGVSCRAVPLEKGAPSFPPQQRGCNGLNHHNHPMKAVHSHSTHSNMY